MTKLLLLDDIPAGRNVQAYVEFNHSLYAELLRDVLIDNRSGICVGFFARWGQGKSSVVNLLQSMLGSRAELVVFNAYQARGDSVRRQLLLAVLRKIDPKQAEEFERFTQVVTPVELQTAEVRESYEGRKLVTLMLKSKADTLLAIAGIGAGVSAGLLFWFVSVVLFTSASYEDKQKAIVSALGFSFVFFAGFISRWIQKRKDKILAYTQPVSDSQRLKYPEQFSRVFRQSVEKFNQTSGRRLILVVDDLDRCDPDTVVEALASVRHFCHGEAPMSLDCQFLMPCDEKQLLSALESDGYNYHDYSKTEMLRKFFDVVVRMDEIVPESLAKYAAQLAKSIGVDPMLARDMVDAGGVREPRKVKALLNSYCLAREAVLRNQSAGVLPPLDQLDRLDATLAVLVCLQELAPKTFAEIQINPDPLNGALLGGSDEPVAARIVAGLGPVSVATADVLITKQYEPSLRGLIVAHSLSAADRNGNVSDVVKLMTEATPLDRDQMMVWLTGKLRQARSSARIKELLTYVLELGREIGWDQPAFLGFLRDLRRWKSILQDALRLGNRLDIFCILMEQISDSDRHFFDTFILRNYLNAPDRNAPEERYLLHFSNRLTGEDADDARRALESSVFQNPTPSIERLNGIAANIAVLNENAGAGFAANLGERLFNLLPQNALGQPLHEVSLKVGLRFIRGNQQVATRLLQNVLMVRMQSPTDLTKEYMHNNAIYFRLLQGLLTDNQTVPVFADFFKKYYWSWIESQNDSFGRIQCIVFIQPGWGMLPKPELARIGSQLGPWIWDDKNFAKTATQLIDQPERAEPEWLAGRDELRTQLFHHFSKQIRGNGNQPVWVREFFGAVRLAGWSVAESAEELLAEKVRQFSVGEACNLKDWREALAPLCTKGLSRIQQAITVGFGKTNQPSELISFAQKSLWKDGIPMEMAQPLVEAILRDPLKVFSSPEAGTQLANMEGFDEVARVLWKQLPSRGAQWMIKYPVFLKSLSEWAALNVESSRRFQEAVVDTLLTGNSLNFAQLGFELLSVFKSVTADVQRSLTGWAQRDEADAASKARFLEASRLPLLA